MGAMESILIWGSVYCYAVITMLLLIAFVFNKERPLAIAGYLLAPAFVAHSLVFILRWTATGYFPANGEYENGLSGGWFVIGLTLYLFLRRKGLRGVGLVTVPAALFFLGYGLMVDPANQPVGPALKSSWLVVHVLFAQLAF